MLPLPVGRLRRSGARGLYWVSTLLAVAALGLAGSGCAVTPSVPFNHSTFEGFEVISYVPEHPRGLVYVFHGTNGSARFAERVETVDVLNRLIASGYGFVSTSSTERTGDRRWDVANASTHDQPRPGPAAPPARSTLVDTTGRCRRRRWSASACPTARGS